MRYRSWFGWRRAATVAAFGLAVVPNVHPLAATTAPPVAFTHEVAVDPQRLAGEPNIAIADNGLEKYSGAPWGFSTTTSFLWKTEDGGAQWDSLHGCLQPVQHVTCSRGGGDSEIQLGTPQGNGAPQAAYFGDLNSLDTLTCAYSIDGGNTWSVAGTAASAGAPVVPVGGEACNVGSGQPPGSDRQWIAVWPKQYNGTSSDILYMAYDTGDTPPSNDDLLISTDAGHSWTAGATLFQGANNYPSGNVDGTRPGPLVINKVTGTLYQFYERYTGGTMVDISCDHGATFQKFDIAPPGTFAHGTTFDFVAGAIDNQGNLYSTWTVNNGASLTGAGDPSKPWKVYYAHSTDGDSTPSGCATPIRGTSWSAPVALTGAASEGKGVGVAAPGVTAGVYPWIAAGDPGRVDVAYIGTTQALPYAPDSQDAPWYVHMAQSLNARDAATFTDTQVTEQPMHGRSICFLGIGCTATGGNRQLADFFQVKVDPLGRADLIFADDNNTAAATPQGNPGGAMVNFVEQSSGPSLYASVNSGSGLVFGPGASLTQSLDLRSTVTDPTGDAKFPAHAASVGANLDPADITGVQIVAKDSATFKVLINVKDLSGGPTAAVTGTHTGAEWMAEWRHANDVWFAAATTDLSGSTSFFAGKPLSEDLTGGGPKAFGYISAAGQNQAVSGAFHQNQNQIEIDVPVSAVGSADGDILYSLQGFTFGTGGGQGEAAPFADQIDATAPIDVPLSLSAGTVPETPLAAALLALGGGAALIAWRRRRVRSSLVARELAPQHD